MTSNTAPPKWQLLEPTALWSASIEPFWMNPSEPHFREKLFESLEAVQKDLGEWIALAKHCSRVCQFLNPLWVTITNNIINLLLYNSFYITMPLASSLLDFSGNLKEDRMRKPFISAILAFSALIFLSSPVFAGSFSFSWGNDQKAEPSPTAVKTKKNGPPAHAPAHGYRAKHQYDYYPSSSVYHDADRGLYFYLNGSNWQVAASLPHDLRFRLGSSVSIEMDTDKPYTYNDQHRKQYPPGKMKKMNKKKKNKWAK